MAILDNLVSYYKLDESSGAVLDVHGSNDGTNNGATPNVTGKINTAYDFVAANTDYISLGNPANLKITGNITISLWVYLDGTASTNRFVAKGNSYFFWFSGDNGLGYFAIDLDGGAVPNSGTSTTDIRGGWHHVVGVNDGTNLKIYIDGTEESTDTTGGGIVTNDTNVEFGRNVGGSEYFDGKLDEIGIWDRALSDNEISDLYNSGDGLPYATSISYIKTKLIIGDTIYTDADRIRVTSSIGVNNASSSFKIDFPNFDGEHKTDFNIGDEVIVYADKYETPITRIITGIIEDIKFKGKEIKETIMLRGRDYTARLQDVTVEPEVYNNQEVSVIVKDIITKYVDNITVTNVNTTTTTLSHISFNQMPVFDALKQLAELSGFIFWIDVDKDLNFKAKGITSSGKTLDNTNVIRSEFRETDKELYNKIWVYGDRILTSWQNIFTADGTGSVYTIDYKPHNTEVNVAGSVMLRGGIFEMIFDAPASGTEYLIDYNSRNIVLCSGTQCGDNIADNGVAVVVDYDRGTPIIKYGENRTSIDLYGPKTKVINDKNITDPQMAKDIVVSTLDQYSLPSMQGLITLQGTVYLVAGNTVVVNLSNQDISSETYDILEAKYDFTTKNCQANSVLTVKVSKKLKDFVDTLKQLILDLKRLQAGDIDITDVYSRMEFATGSFGVAVKNWKVETRTLGSSFILGHPGIQSNPQGGGILGSVVSSGINFLGDTRSSLSTQQSGGTW